jgi:hypothetical protein
MTSNQWWSLLKSLLWIATRDEGWIDTQLERKSELSLNSEINLELTLTLVQFGRHGVHHTLGYAKNDLLGKLRDGRIIASGIATAKGQRADISNLDWHDLEISGDPWRASSKYGKGSTRENVLLPAAAMRAVWPAEGTAGTASGYMDRLMGDLEERNTMNRAEEAEFASLEWTTYSEAVKTAGPILFPDTWVGPISHHDSVVQNFGSSHRDWVAVQDRKSMRDLQIEEVECWLRKSNLVDERRGTEWVATAALNKALAIERGEAPPRQRADIENWELNEIAAMIDAGASNESITQRFNIDITAIRQIRNEPQNLATYRQWREERDQLVAKAEDLKRSCRLPNSRRSGLSVRVELWSAVAWLATGKVREWRTLERHFRRAARRNGRYVGQQGLDASEVWVRIEKACDEILEAARAGKIKLIGQKWECQKGTYIKQANGPCVLPEEYLLARVGIFPMKNAIEADRSQDFPPYVDLRDLPQYRDVVLNREDLERLWPSTVSGEGETRTNRTSASEADCRKKLATLMRTGSPTKPKDNYRKDFPQVGNRAFARAWADALVDVGDNLAQPWRKPGPKSKR